MYRDLLRAVGGLSEHLGDFAADNVNAPRYVPDDLDEIQETMSPAKRVTQDLVRMQERHRQDFQVFPVASHPIDRTPYEVQVGTLHYIQQSQRKHLRCDIANTL